ncbi:MAG: DUF3783 domain-containing protein [Lachnospiraceae bacterium]|nr:DUF3783 domain-containing protein [Lachnospiraceae bacterium]MCI7042656.1 DUF3783 domain-containing protein [Lachnospiraceae bacterium]MDD7626749.1 DUF3783 domain-containing protein [Lachnospiraceae bacterium]MDY4117963.1 DUF3783 domain-containing protein [Lachnospiraceae bacterium]
MEKILAFQVRETDLQKLKGISASMRIKLVVIDKVDFRQTVNDLLSQKKNPLVEPYNGQITESMLLLHEFSDKRLDALLKALRREQVKVDFKAVTTKTNIKWTVLQLFFEMEKERKAYLQMNQ